MRMNDVAERAEADDQESRRAVAHGDRSTLRPIRASRSRVEWSFGSPTMAVRPP